MFISVWQVTSSVHIENRDAWAYMDVGKLIIIIIIIIIINRHFKRLN